MNENEDQDITISYPWEPECLDHWYKKHKGYFCWSIVWEEGKGTIEIWRKGEFNPDLYIELENLPCWN